MNAIAHNHLSGQSRPLLSQRHSVAAWWLLLAAGTLENLSKHLCSEAVTHLIVWDEMQVLICWALKLRKSRL